MKPAEKPVQDGLDRNVGSLHSWRKLSRAGMTDFPYWYHYFKWTEKGSRRGSWGKGWKYTAPSIHDKTSCALRVARGPAAITPYVN